MIKNQVFCFWDT